ncbi:MAG TPA: hypothetical protein VHX37_18100 [Acidobacteriaceae bacterium]|jgi:hypothetical protein|nr:hypothetical protein [Acidobacteriaceae bacterium]
MSTHNPPSGQNSPNLDPRSHAGDPSVKEGYEVTDANTGGIIVFLVALFISVGVFFVFCYGMGKVINNALDKADGPANKWNAANQIAPQKEIQSNPAGEQEQLAKLTQQFPSPRLQIDNGDQDLATLHEREDLLLDYYSWIDRSKGTVRIPIGRAMELIAQRGLPVAPAQQQQPLMMGDSRPTVQMPLTDGFAPSGYEQELHGRAQQAGEQTSSVLGGR